VIKAEVIRVEFVTALQEYSDPNNLEVLTVYSASLFFACIKAIGFSGIFCQMCFVLYP